MTTHSPFLCYSLVIVPGYYMHMYVVESLCFPFTILNLATIAYPTFLALNSTQAMLQPPLIVVLGGSFPGISVVHPFLDNLVDQLRTFEMAPSYRVILVGP
jgi:hypothetical protein